MPTYWQTENPGCQITTSVPFKEIAEGVLDSLINNHQAKRLFGRPEPRKRASG